MSNAYLTRMPAGIAGSISRQDSKTIESLPFGATAFASFGIPCKYGAAGAVVPIGAADVGASVIGFLVRPYPAMNGTGGSALGVAVPPTAGIANVMKRGYISVVSNAGTPAAGGAVYVRIDTPAGAKVVGGIEASSDTTHSVAVPNAYFTGVADAAGNVEVAFNI